MTWQLATAKIYNGTQWINAAGGSKLAAPTAGPNVPYNLGNVTLTASATPNTKGAWVEIIASTAADCHRLMLSIGANFLSTVNSSALMDIGIGAAGAETVILENYGTGYSFSSWVTDIPCYIPSGTRVAARIQSATASRTQTVGFGFANNYTTPTVLPSTTWTAWGISTANSRGTGVVPGGNVKGAWTQIVASTATASEWIGIAIQGNGNTGMQGVTHIFDIGIGAAGAETAIVNNIRVTSSNNENIAWTSFLRGFFVDIPAGSRISVRDQAGTATPTGAFYLDVALYGIEKVGSL